MDTMSVPCPSSSLGEGTPLAPLVKVLALMIFLLHKVELKSSASTHLPRQLDRMGPSPLSLMLGLSGQIPVSMNPTMTPSPKSVSRHTPNPGSRPRNPEDLVVRK